MRAVGMRALITIVGNRHEVVLEFITNIDRPGRKDHKQLEMSGDNSVPFSSVQEDIPL